MSDRLRAVRRVRELMERRRTADLAVANRGVTDAVAVRAAARAARGQLTSAAGVVSADDLRRSRATGLAAQDAVTAADRALVAAEREAEIAHGARVEAATARRSVERVSERRAAAAALVASRRAERHLDDVALQRWLRS